MSDPTFEIPPRNTRAFAEYKAGVEWDYANGATIEAKYAIRVEDEWSEVHHSRLEWNIFNYRTKPKPPELHPIDQWRAMSPEEREGKVLERRRRDGSWTRSSYSEDIDGFIHEGDRLLTYQIRELTLAERNAAVRAKWEAMEETADAAIRESVDGTRMTWECRGGDSEWRRAAIGAIARWFEDLEYRLVPAPEPPQPRYVPWTIDSCPVGAVIRAKNTARVRVMIIGAAAQSAAVSQAGSYTYEQLLEEWTMDDGTPCGTLEQPQP